MLRLFLRDIETGLTVEAPKAPPLFMVNPENGNPQTLLKWSHKDAVGALVEKVAEKEGKNPMEILMSDRDPFEMYATWEVVENAL